jgi:hypothetical protein
MGGDDRLDRKPAFVQMVCKEHAARTVFMFTASVAGLPGDENDLLKRRIDHRECPLAEDQSA